jgi:hypothetical protein
MKVANPNLTMWLNCWWCGVFKGAKEFVFWFVLLFCRLLQGNLSKLVSVMECDLGYSMKTLHELRESQFCKGIGKELYGE